MKSLTSLAQYSASVPELRLESPTPCPGQSKGEAGGQGRDLGGNPG